MVLLQEKSVLVTLLVVSGTSKSKWGIAVNTLYTILKAHHIMTGLSATAAVTKVKEICIHFLCCSYINQIATTPHFPVRLSRGRYYFLYWLLQGSSPKTIPQCSSTQHRPSLPQSNLNLKDYIKFQFSLWGSWALPSMKVSSHLSVVLE